MKIDVKELYKDESCGWYDYQPMLNVFGKVAIQDYFEVLQIFNRVIERLENIEKGGEG